MQPSSNPNNNKVNKENNTKETTTEVVAKKDAAKAATTERRKLFFESLIPFVEEYGKETVRAFFDYWSEFNRSETRMKFELEKTFETKKRLATWKRREKENTPAKSNFCNYKKGETEYEQF